MGTHFLLVGLLCLCGLSLSHECRRELLVDVDFPKTDISTLSSPDAEHCQLLCTQHARCLFFTFLRPDWEGNGRKFFCYLKSTPSGQPKVQRPRQGHTSGFSLKPCHPDPQPCLSQVYHHVDFLGADYRTLFTPDYEECQRVCTQDPACQFFTFLKRDFADGKYRYKCHLKYSWTVPKIPKIIRLSTRISGFSQRKQLTTPDFGFACKGGLFPNTDIPGHDVEVLPAVSPEHCQALCSAHPRCTYFSYISQPFECHLKNNPHAIVSKPAAGITSGLPARFCQPDNNWIKKTYVGIDFPHSDIRKFQTSGVEACQRACTEDPNCQYYSYITAEISQAAARRRCFLQRVITMPAPPIVTKLAHAVSGFSLRNCYHQGLVWFHQFPQTDMEINMVYS